MSTLSNLQVIVLQLVADNPTLATNDPKYSTMINATIICVAIHSALSLSGNIFFLFLQYFLSENSCNFRVLDGVSSSANTIATGIT